MKKRIEFPLFELVLILILLSVLSIVAIPRFIGVGVEARVRALNATVLNLTLVNRLLYSRALIKGVEDNALQSTAIFADNRNGDYFSSAQSPPPPQDSIEAYLVYGELRAQEADLQRYLESDLLVYGKHNRPGVIRLYLDIYENNSCYVDYQQAVLKRLADGQHLIQKATYKVKSSGC